MSRSKTVIMAATDGKHITETVLERKRLETRPDPQSQASMIDPHTLRSVFYQLLMWLPESGKLTLYPNGNTPLTLLSLLFSEELT